MDATQSGARLAVDIDRSPAGALDATGGIEAPGRVQHRRRDGTARAPASMQAGGGILGSYPTLTRSI